MASPPSPAVLSHPGYACSRNSGSGRLRPPPEEGEATPRQERVPIPNTGALRRQALLSVLACSQQVALAALLFPLGAVFFTVSLIFSLTGKLNFFVVCCTGFHKNVPFLQSFRSHQTTKKPPFFRAKKLRETVKKRAYTAREKIFEGL